MVRKRPVGWRGHPHEHNMARLGIETRPPYTVRADGRRKVVEEFEVANFDDLPEDVKERALENYRYINVEHDWWDFEGLLDFSEEELEKWPADMREKYLESKMLLFSYKIGAFEFDRDTYLQFEEVKVNDEDMFYSWLGIPQSMRDKVHYVFSTPTGSVWSGERSTNLEFRVDEELTGSEASILENATLEFKNKVHEALSSLRDEYYYQLSDEAVAETLRANEYEFTEDGEIY